MKMEVGFIRGSDRMGTRLEFSRYKNNRFKTQNRLKLRSNIFKKKTYHLDALKKKTNHREAGDVLSSDRIMENGECR